MNVYKYYFFKSTANNCPRLEYLQLKNLENISDHGIRYVLLNCKNIKELHLNGDGKGVTDQCFSGISSENVPKLQLLDMRFGPEIPDIVLEKLLDKSKHLKIRNAENKRVECKKWRRTPTNSRDTTPSRQD